MPIEESEIAYAILVNKDGFVKLTRITYPKMHGPSHIMKHAIKPRFEGDMIDTADFRIVDRISADQAQQRYGLLLRAFSAIIYQEI